MIHKYFVSLIFLLIASFWGIANGRDLAKPELMLANVYHSGIDLSKYWVSEKYDGVRAIWDGKQLVSRGGNIYHAPAWFTENFPKQKMDGELWIDRQSFELLLSTVRDDKPDEKAWQRVKFMVFDMPDPPVVFDDRIRCMQRLIDDLKIPWLKRVKQWKVPSHAGLMSQLKKMTDEGAEGLMLHRGMSFYRGKRSGDLLKVKPYQDAEARVIAHVAGKGKYTHSLGALLLEMPSGIQFKVGSGFSDEERKHPPAIGETVTYQYRGFTKNGVPRFATFLRIRKIEK